MVYYSANSIYYSSVTNTLLLSQVIKKIKTDTRRLFQQIWQKNKKWDDNKKQDSNSRYCCPAFLDMDITGSSIAEAAERKLFAPDHDYILINFALSRFNQLTDYTLHVEKLPQEAIAGLFSIESIEDMHKLFPGKENPHNQFLRDKMRFIRTSQVIQGQAVYREIKTNRIWYLDNLHKIHFEVFSKEIIHLGEADINTGVLNELKKDARKNNSFKVN